MIPEWQAEETLGLHYGDTKSLIIIVTFFFFISFCSVQVLLKQHIFFSRFLVEYSIKLSPSKLPNLNWYLLFCFIFRRRRTECFLSELLTHYVKTTCKTSRKTYTRQSGKPGICKSTEFKLNVHFRRLQYTVLYCRYQTRIFKMPNDKLFHIKQINTSFPAFVGAWTHERWARTFKVSRYCYSQYFNTN